MEGMQGEVGLRHPVAGFKEPKVTSILSVCKRCSTEAPGVFQAPTLLILQDLLPGFLRAVLGMLPRALRENEHSVGIFPRRPSCPALQEVFQISPLRLLALGVRGLG